MAPLQKRAWYGLLIGLVFAIALVVVFIIKGGISLFEEDQGFRIVIDILWVGGLMVNLIVFDLTLRKPSMVDERDRLIMDRSSRVQWLSVVFLLVSWTIAISEIYHNQGQIPVIFLYIIFMSVLIISTLAQSLGILIGYWRMARNGQNN